MANATRSTGMTITLPNGVVIENASLEDIRQVTALVAGTDTTAPAVEAPVLSTRLNAAGRVVDATTGQFVKVPAGRVNPPKAGSTPKGKAAKPRKAAKKAQTKAQKEFVGWLKESAPARKARQKSNSEMAAWMRKNGLQPRGAAWEAAKHGERSVGKLQKVQAKEIKAAKKA